MVTCKTNFSFSEELNAIINDGNMSLHIISLFTRTYNFPGLYSISLDILVKRDSLKGVLLHLPKISMFCDQSQNYQHRFEK